MPYYFNCIQCGVDFKRAKRTGTYCSLACQKAAAPAKVIGTCPQCNKEFIFRQSWPRKYCSLTCSALSYSIDRADKVNVVCAQCAKPMQRIRSRLAMYQHHFCSRNCKSQYQIEHRKGIPNIKNRKPKPEMRKRVIQTCKKCGKITEVKESHAANGGGRYCSLDCARMSRSGSNSHFWRGGNETHRDYGSNWDSQRRNVRKRDNYTCQRCGVSEADLGHQLSVHHIKPFRLFGIERYKEANTVTNLVCYCPPCHNIVERATC